MKRAVTLLLSLAVAAATFAPASLAGEDGESSKKDPRAERERVRREKARAAAKLDALRADAADLEQALADLADNVAYEEAMLADARDAQVQADANVRKAGEEVDAMRERIAALDAAVKQAALAAYTSTSSSADVMSAFVNGNPTDALQQDVLYGLVASDVAGALDELAAAHKDLKAAERKAEKALKRADEHRRAVEAEILDLETSIEAQEQLAERIDERIDQTLSEAANLAELDAELSKEIAAREARLARLVPSARIKPSSSSGSGSDPPDIEVPQIPVVGGLVRVNGITVDASIGPAIAQLVEWAAQDGIRLTGGGYRSSADQIAVRRNNCGPTNYDIYVKPSSQCRPPAARPGKSMHEKGLAVDLACNGELISNYQHWCYDWIARQAPRVGLRNRGVEAWHWSPNGN